MQQFPLPPLGPVIPEILLTLFAMIVLVADLMTKRKETLAFISVISAAAVIYWVLGTKGVTFSGMFIADGFGMFFKLIFLLTLILSVLISIRYLDATKVKFGEYYSILMFATVGMMVMASANDLIVLYLGLELMALSSYVLTGFVRYEGKSTEAAIKYFLLGAFASAVLLYGTSLLYGLTGTTNIKDIAQYIGANGLVDSPALMLAVIMYIVAFGFKIGAAPFHMWVPDVYQGAPTPATAFLSVGPKAAGFAALGRVFMVAFSSVQVEWAPILVAMAILTMAVGSIIALAQTNIKRMLAYSSIAHAGYALLGLIAGTPEGIAGMMSYLMIYAFMNIGAFAIVIMLRSEGYSSENIGDYEGLAKKNPLSAALMLVFMFSLTGIPPTAGFIGKFFVFAAAVKAGYTWLVVVAVIFSAISAFFYLRIVIYMYMREPKEEVSLETSPSLNLALAVSAIAVLVIGVLPGKLLQLAKMAASVNWL